MALRIGTILGAITVLVTFAADAPANSAIALAGPPALLAASALTVRKRGEPAPRATHLRRTRSGFANALLGALVFLQFGCEWGLGIWLAIYLMRTLGTSPVTALSLESLYFALLALARALCHRFLGSFSRRVLLIALVIAMTGDLVLAGAESVAEAALALLLLACGLAPVYSLTRNILDERFVFEPRLYRRLFLNGVVGAAAAGCALAYVDLWLGLRAIPFLALIASSAVSILQLVLVFEKHLMGSTAESLTGE
jgi:hypothetical protein